MRSKAAIALGCATVVVGVTAALAAGASGPDHSFGGDGKVTTRIGNAGRSTALTALIDARGRSVVGGTTGAGFGTGVVVRYARNGERDNGFGDDGIVRIPLENNAEVSAIIERSGAQRGFYVAGSFRPRHRRAVDRLAFIAKLDSHGALVHEYGDGGIATLPNFHADGSYFERNENLVEGPAGSVFVSVEDESGVRVLKLTASGAIAPSFGNNGSVELPYEHSASFPENGGLVEDDDGHLIASTCENKGFNALRIDLSGNPDPSFGEGGHLSFNPPGDVRRTGCRLSVTHGGRLLGGPGGQQANSRGGRISIIKLKPNGELSQDFGVLGVATFHRTPAGEMEDLQALPSGRIAIAARQGKAYAKLHFAELRLTSDGRLDRSFGRRGGVGLDFNQGPSQPSAIEYQHGRVLMAGSAGYRDGFPPRDGAELIAAALIDN